MKPHRICGIFQLLPGFFRDRTVPNLDIFLRFFLRLTISEFLQNIFKIQFRAVLQVLFLFLQGNAPLQ